jgi:hypothetical protein
LQHVRRKAIRQPIYLQKEGENISPFSISQIFKTKDSPTVFIGNYRQRLAESTVEEAIIIKKTINIEPITWSLLYGIGEIIYYDEKYGKSLGEVFANLNVPESIWKRESLDKLINEKYVKKEAGRVIAEDFSLWKKEIEFMKNSVMLWDWITNDKKENLKAVVIADDIEEDIYSFTLGYALGDYLKIKDFHHQREKEKRSNWGLIASEMGLEYRLITDFNKNTGEYLLSKFKSGNYKFLPQLILNYRINTKKHATLRLLIDESGDPIDYAIPNDLLSAMWYQFHQAVALGEKNYRQCKVCGDWEHGKQSNWEYHDSCGTAFRVRKKRALDDISAGKPLNEVAKKYAKHGFSSEDLQKWVKERKQNSNLR